MKSPEQLLQESPQVAKFIGLSFIVGWSLMIGMGILQIGVAYFGLRLGQEWALWILGLSKSDDVNYLLVHHSHTSFDQMTRSFGGRSSFTRTHSYLRSLSLSR